VWNFFSTCGIMSVVKGLDFGAFWILGFWILDASISIIILVANFYRTLTVCHALFKVLCLYFLT
jgi:hypothetical protein